MRTGGVSSGLIPTYACSQLCRVNAETKQQQALDTIDKMTLRAEERKGI